MKRRHFLLVSAIISLIIGVMMFVAPTTFLNDIDPGSNPIAEFYVRVVAVGLFVLGLVNFSARRDAWSDSMKAILLGNLCYHILSIGLDIYGYIGGLVGTRALTSGLVIHAALMVGFMVMLSVPSRQDDVIANTARS